MSCALAQTFESVMILVDGIGAGHSPGSASEYLLVTVKLRTWLGDSSHISASIEVIRRADFKSYVP